MRRLVCVIGALALTATAAGASTVNCGLRGKVFALPGGACLDNDCGMKPLKGATLMFSTAGRTAARTVTSSDGSYRVRLAPGTYSVRLAQGTRLIPSRASVTQGTFKRVTFVLGNPKIPEPGQ